MTTKLASLGGTNDSDVHHLNDFYLGIFLNFSGILIISIKADIRNFSQKYQQTFLLERFILRELITQKYVPVKSK